MISKIIKILSLINLAIIFYNCSSEYVGQIDIISPVPLQNIKIIIKPYNDTEPILTNYETQISSSRTGYYTSGDNVDSPLKIGIVFPSEGVYAIHIIGYPQESIDNDGSIDGSVDGGADDTIYPYYVVTRCFSVTSSFTDNNVLLVGLSEDLDSDRDTVPDNFELYCQMRNELNSDCEQECMESQYLAGVDCDPEEKTVNPFENEICGDGIDQNCWNGDKSCEDIDDDGYSGTEDCNENDPLINIGASEICGNGIDENCKIDISGCTDGDIPCDNDGDNYYGIINTGCGTDCDDNNSAIYPDAQELCGDNGNGNNIDEDCDRFIDEGCIPDDLDRDGFADISRGGQDCNDCDPGINPGINERTGLCSDNIDQNCDDTDEQCSQNDEDRDWYVEPDDCRENDPKYYPEAPDFCDDGEAFNCILDTECNVDTDNDRYNSSNDCNDQNAEINAGVENDNCEDELDNNCNGIINEVWDTSGTDNIPMKGCIKTAANYEAIDFNSSIEHCGSCRYDCRTAGQNGKSLGDRCINGICQCGESETCPQDQDGEEWICCNSNDTLYCADIKNDSNNCSSCGNTCNNGLECINGQCLCPGTQGIEQCEVGMTCCSGSGCLNLQNDNNNCGQCGNECSNGDICINGNCICENQGRDCNENLGERCCNGLCKNINHDINNCGQCGNSCGSNTRCLTGGCICNGGYNNCDLDWNNGCECYGCCEDEMCIEDCGTNASCYQESNYGECICNGGFSSCDGNWENGCECDGCCNNNSCMTSCGINAYCDSVGCQCNSSFGNCDDGWDNGCEISFNNDSYNCGRCNYICGEHSSCSNGSCACEPLYHDCDFNDSNGCECSTCCVMSGCVVVGDGDVGDGCCDTCNPAKHTICNSFLTEMKCICEQNFVDCNGDGDCECNTTDLIYQCNGTVCCKNLGVQCASGTECCSGNCSTTCQGNRN